MSADPGPTAHVVDDDAAIRDALAWLLASRWVAARTWGSAEAFLEGWRPEMRGCLVLDVRMGGMSGIELFDRLQALGSGLPVLFLTGHGDVPLAVSALKKGAFDFVEKPFNDNQLVDRVLEAIRQGEARRQEREAGAGISLRIRLLTARERQVMERVARGQPNKAIADELDIALRTVEVHRSRVFEKMGVRSAVELARLLAQIGR